MERTNTKKGASASNKKRKIGTQKETVRKNPRKGKKKGEDVKKARPPTEEQTNHRTNRYGRYNWGSHRQIAATSPRFRMKHDIYKNFKLITGDPLMRNFTVDRTPINSVRLDDKWIGLVVSFFRIGQLGVRWPSEFDKRGMTRATRGPLGDPCLVWVEEGQLDVHGIPTPRTGCYYGWHRGLQLLCGDQGYERFMVRPSHEEPLSDGITFKSDYPAEGKKQDAWLRAIYDDEGVTIVVEKHNFGPKDDTTDENEAGDEDEAMDQDDATDGDDAADESALGMDDEIVDFWMTLLSR